MVLNRPASTGRKIVPTASLRDDPFGRRYAYRHIDDAKYRIALFLLELLELAEIGSARAIHPGKEAVDGLGAYVESITDAVFFLRGSREPRVLNSKCNGFWQGVGSPFPGAHFHLHADGRCCGMVKVNLGPMIPRPSGPGSCRVAGLHAGGRAFPVALSSCASGQCLRNGVGAL
jgi:hypothetical protein